MPRAAHAGVVLVGLRDPECGHDRVAGELLDRPAVLRDALRGAFEVAGHAAANDFRIDRCHELSGIDQVDEQNDCEPLHESSVGSGLLLARTTLDYVSALAA